MWKFPDVFLPYFALDLPHKALQSSDDIRAGFSLFLDEKSRREYIGQLTFRLFMDFDGLALPITSDHYFSSDLFDLGTEEVMMDCGAFDGDTIAEFIRHRGDSFASIIAFEPDQLNLEKMQQRLQGYSESVRQKIRVLPYALGERNETLYFDATGSNQSKSGNGSIPVQCVALDSVHYESAPTLIKFDIEGAELGALKGACDLISRCRPVLAVSAYHQQDHLWQVPLALDQICHDYQFFLRPCGAEGWDLICYAIPSERLKRR